MRIETLLPLGKVDPGLRAPETPFDITTVAEKARLLEDIGYDGLVCEETKDDPFIVLALAAQATTRLHLTTGVAIAFPRSPTVTAMTAWTLQKLSNGRFTLGLGTQVRAHIERRFGMKWSPAAPWISEYIAAIRAIWHAWQTGTQPKFEGQHYNINLMVPLFDPGPIAHPAIPIHLAAVNRIMSRVAGEHAEGLRPHPVCTPSYIENVMKPAIREGAARSNRTLDDFRIAMKPLVATAETEADLQPKIRDARARIAFYASTPAYFAAFAHLGLDDLANKCKLLSRAQQWEELARQINDDVLQQFAVIDTYDHIGRRLRDRFQNVVTDIEFSIAVNNDREREILKDLARTIQAA